MRIIMRIIWNLLLWISGGYLGFCVVANAIEGAKTGIWFPFYMHLIVGVFLGMCIHKIDCLQKKI